jgi:hypothetical protein
MAKVRATRLLKIRNAVTVLSQLPDARSNEDIKPYEELSEDDQQAVQLFTKCLIDLFDGLFDKSINVTTKAERK